MIHRKEERTKKRGRENQSNKDESIKHIRKQITTEAEIIKQKKKDRNQQSAVADPGGGARPPPPLFLGFVDQTEVRRAKKNLLGDRPTLPLS